MRQMLVLSLLNAILKGRQSTCKSQKVWKHKVPVFREQQEVPGTGAWGRGVSRSQRDAVEGKAEILDPLLPEGPHGKQKNECW